MTARTASRPAARPGPVTRSLLWAGGVDPDLLDTRLEVYRGASIGAFVIGVALLGTVTFTLYGYVIVGHPVPWLLPFSAFWGAIIFWLDRSILVDPHYGNLSRAERASDSVPLTALPLPWPPQPSRATPRASRPAPRRDWSGVVRPLVYLIRVAIAVIVAFLVSEVVVLLIFRPEIRARIADAQDGAFEVRMTEVADQQQAALGPQISRLKADLAANTAAVAAAHANMITALNVYDGEYDGTSGSLQPGYGPRDQQDWQNYLAARSTYDNTVRSAQAADDRLDAKISALTADQSNVVTAGTPQFEALERGPVGKQLYALTHPAAGWLDDENALAAFQRANQGLAVASIPWLIRTLFLLVDLTPLGFKLLTGGTVYGRRVRDQGQLLRYRDRQDDRLRRADLDRAAELRDYRTALAALLDYEKHERYRGHRMDHLLRPPGGFDD